MDTHLMTPRSRGFLIAVLVAVTGLFAPSVPAQATLYCCPEVRYTHQGGWTFAQASGNLFHATMVAGDMRLGADSGWRPEVWLCYWQSPAAQPAPGNTSPNGLDIPVGAFSRYSLSVNWGYVYTLQCVPISSPSLRNYVGRYLDPDATATAAFDHCDSSQLGGQSTASTALIPGDDFQVLVPNTYSNPNWSYLSGVIEERIEDGMCAAPRYLAPPTTNVYYVRGGTCQ